MLTAGFCREVVEHVDASIERVGLSQHKDELVVIGGTAMATFGIKPHNPTDLDMVGTNGLIDSLEDTGRWLKGWEFGQGWLDNNHFSPHNPAATDFDTRMDKTVSLLRAPLDSLYPVTAEELIAEAVIDDQTMCRFVPPTRVLEWKIALINSDDYLRDKSKHVHDASLIAQHLLELRGHVAS